MSEPTMRELMQAAFDEVPVHKLIDLRVVAAGDDGPAVIEIPLAPNALGNTGNLHGGVIGVICDVACAIAANGAATYDHATHALVTADLHIRYLGPARGERVRAEAQVVKAGRTLIVVEATVTDSEGRDVAVADFSAMLVPRRS